MTFRKDVLSVLSESVLRATPRFLDFCRARPAAGGEGDVGTARCEFGTDASLEGGAVVIKTGRSALAFA